MPKSLQTIEYSLMNANHETGRIKLKPCTLIYLGAWRRSSHDLISNQRYVFIILKNNLIWITNKYLIWTIDLCYGTRKKTIMYDFEKCPLNKLYSNSQYEKEC